MIGTTSLDPIYYISNVFEDSVKAERGITTDSPAANRKVISLCSAVKRAGGFVEVVSLGRGRSQGTWKSFPVTVAQAGTVPITYLRYLDVPLLTHFVTMISLLSVVMRKARKNSVFVFYNYYPHYLLALLFCSLTGSRCVLDIEDGCRSDDKSFRNLPGFYLLKIHNWCCRAGTMLAASELRKQATGDRFYLCHGIADTTGTPRDWSLHPLQVHLGGALFEETGALLFLETLKRMSLRPKFLKRFKFVVTGFGPCADAISEAAMSWMQGSLYYHGNVTSSEYRSIMMCSHVGLCLKMPASSMGATTFPSKVVELSSNGLLLVSTRVSDVPVLFDETTAFLLDAATPEALEDVLSKIADHPYAAGSIAMAGSSMVASQLSVEKIGRELLQFWQGI